jgi:hypothetical protein
VTEWVLCTLYMPQSNNGSTLYIILPPPEIEKYTTKKIRRNLYFSLILSAVRVYRCADLLTLKNTTPMARGRGCFPTVDIERKGSAIKRSLILFYGLYPEVYCARENRRGVTERSSLHFLFFMVASLCRLIIM